MNLSKKSNLLQPALTSIILLIFMSIRVFAQPRYEIEISDISYLKVHQNWLFVPSAVDLRIKWSVLQKEVLDGRQQVTYVDPATLPFTYHVQVFEQESGVKLATSKARHTDFLDIPRKKIGGKFSFKISAYNEHSMLIAESETASIVVGKGNPNGLSEKTWLYYIHPGRWQLASVGKSDIYDKSTPLGKLAFIFLSTTALLSFVILLFYSSRTLYLGNIFPLQRSTRGLFWSLSGSCDSSYDNRITNKFKFVLNAWESVAARSRAVTVNAMKNIPQGLSSTEKMASVDVACMEYWNSDGDDAIGTIEDIVSFPEHQNNGKKKPDDLLAELVLKIEDNFRDLFANSQNGSAALSGSILDKQDLQSLIDELYQPVLTDDKPFARLRRWILRKGVYDTKKGLRPFPTSRIISAGLEIHRMNGYRCLKPAEEVKRAFEDRASNEIETLKRKSRIEWFWNYGTLAPMVGLFGTVTGITFAFQQLSQTAVNPDFVSTMQHISKGIFEALWTTIFGLANGIFFIIIYYYYKHKADWIYSKWEEIYVSITEKL